jgi:hypothetical protein
MTLNANIKAAPLGEAGKGFAAGLPFEIIADFGFVLPKRQERHSTGPAPSQHNDLLPQHEDLGFHRRARPEKIDDNRKN